MHGRLPRGLVIAMHHRYRCRACAHSKQGLPSHAPAMFVVSEAEAAAIRAAFQEHGEFAAAVELRRLCPGIRDTAQARACVRTIAGWRPLPKRLLPARLRVDKTDRRAPLPSWLR